MVKKLPVNKRTRWLHWWILSHVQRRSNSSPSQTHPKNSREDHSSNSLYEASNTLNTKIRQECHKKRNLGAIISDWHQCKNSQQNFSKQNSIIHEKDHTCPASLTSALTGRFFITGATWEPIPQHNKGHIWQAHSLIIREIQIKTPMKYHLRPARMAVIKKITSVGIMWRKGNLYALLVEI